VRKDQAEILSDYTPIEAAERLNQNLFPSAPVKLFA